MSATCQRWRHRRDSYRPAGEPIDPSRYGVEPIADDTTARAFIVAHHYSGSLPAARCRVGLYRTRPFARPELVGVAVFSQPASEAVLPKWLGTSAGVELGRLVLLDDVPASGAVGRWEEVNAVECTHVYPLCEHCGRSPTCAPDCVGVHAALAGLRSPVGDA